MSTNQNPYNPYQDSGENPYAYYSGESSIKPVNGLEILTATLAILMLLGVFAFGLFSQNTKNRDKQRRTDVLQVVAAINLFYANSSTIPSERRYPIAECSAALNEVDYELTLKQHLLGQRTKLDTHSYILKDSYPRDPWGIYSTTLSDRKVKLRDCPRLFTDIQLRKGQIYPDGFPSCNFKSAESRYRRCYIYTSSNSGDSYQIGYYSEDRGGFVTFKRLRENTIQEEFVKA